MGPVYRAGDVIHYATWDGTVRRCTVTERVPEIKNGRDGFDAVTADGMTVWGYDSQIVYVAGRAE